MLLTNQNAEIVACILLYLKYYCYRPLRPEYRTYESELKNGLYRADNARTHASYMLFSTTRKKT